MDDDIRGELGAALEGTYAIERELGGGGMSRVFVAEESSLGRRVVIKVLGRELSASVSAERFAREIRLVARLQDPRIVPLLAAGDAGGLPWYTMPFVDGQTLRARMARGAVSLAEAVAILRDVALALEYAHAHGVVHRDIKPENVLLSGRTAMVADFGIAKAIAASTVERAAGLASAGTLTGTGMSLGTPAYIAPEQASGGDVDQRADIYAWGVLAYELLAGAHPFEGRTSPQALVAAHMVEVPRPLARRAPAVPAGLAALVDRTLAKSADDRPASAAELVRALDGALPSASTPARWTPGSKVVVAAAAAVLLAVAVALAVASRSRATGGRASGGVPPEAGRSIAVMTFSDTRGDTVEAYLAEGMADELTTAIANVPGLRVAPRSSVVRAAAAAASTGEVARALKVSAVLEGTVRRAGDRLRVTATLTGAADGLVLWSDRFDERAADVFDVQDRIAHAIVAALRTRFAPVAALDTTGAPAPSPDSSLGAAPRGTSDLEAYDLYLRGRYYFARRGPDGLRRAAEYFERAIARDPRFARAHAALAMSAAVLPVFARDVPVDSVLALADRSALEALRLDSTLAEAHLALSQSLKMRWRWSEAERHVRDAVALAPEESLGHHWYGVLLYSTGRPDEAVRSLERARALDPFGATVGSDLSAALYFARRFRDARAEIARTLAIDSTKSDSHVILGLAYLGLGHADSAEQAIADAWRFRTGFDMRGYMSRSQRALGRAPAADSLLRALRRDLERGEDVGFDLAIAALGAGDTALALSAVERTIAARSALVSELGLPCEPMLDPLTSDRRFTVLLGRAGMTACPAAVLSRRAGAR